MNVLYWGLKMKRIYSEIYGDEWMRTLPIDMLKDLYCGKSIILRNKIYMVCSDCRKVIQTNKPIIGSTHVCC